MKGLWKIKISSVIFSYEPFPLTLLPVLECIAAKETRSSSVNALRALFFGPLLTTSRLLKRDETTCFK
jgi:hypothetical protein